MHSGTSVSTNSGGIEILGEGGAGTDDGMDFVDKQDRARYGLQFLDHRLQAFLEIAPVLGAGEQRADRYVRPGQFLDRPQTRSCRRDSGLHNAFQFIVHRRYADRDRTKIHRSKLGQYVDVPFDQRALGNQADRVPVFEKQLEQRPGELRSPLGRLVGVGVGADRDWLAGVTGFFPAFEQSCRRLRFEKNLRLEVEAR